MKSGIRRLSVCLCESVRLCLHTIMHQNAHSSMKELVRTKLCVERADTLAKFLLKLFQALKSDFTGCVPGFFEHSCLF